MSEQFYVLNSYNKPISTNMALQISDTTETFETFLMKEFISPETKEILQKATILLVPFEDLRENVEPVFPTGTEETLRYFAAKLPENISIEVCINDEDYQEFSFNSNYKRLGKFVVKKVALPVFIGVLTAFIYDRFIKAEESAPQIQIIDKASGTPVTTHISTLADKKYLEPTHIKFSVTIVDSAGSKDIDFEGLATEIDTVLAALKSYEQR